MKIEDYVNSKTRDERIKHIDLTTPCQDAYTLKKGDLIKIGTKRARYNLRDYLGLEGECSSTIHTCHLCSHSNIQGDVCVNPQHVYFGTGSENQMDKPSAVRKNAASIGGLAGGSKGGKIASKKFTFETRSKAGKIGSRNAIANGNHMNSQTKTCIHCGFKSNPGNIGRYHNDNCKKRVVK